MLVDREEFSALLTRLKPALRAGNALPALTHMWFNGKSARAYDGGFGIRLSLASELECGVPGPTLLGLLATSVLKEATLEQGNSLLSIKLGKATSKVSVLDLEQQLWPFPEKMPKNHKTITLGEEFIEALRKVLTVKVSVATRVEHHGVMAEWEDGKLYLYATDSMTLAMASVDSDGKFPKTLLPRTFAEQMVAQAPGGVDFTVLDDCLIATGDDVVFYSNVLDISGADDLNDIVAKQEEKHGKPVPLPAGLEGALARAEILAGREEALVTLSVEKSSLVVSGDYTLGKLKETLDLEGKHPAAKIRIKASHLRRALPNVDALSLTSNSIILRGEPDFMYLTASL